METRVRQPLHIEIVEPRRSDNGSGAAAESRTDPGTVKGATQMCKIIIALSLLSVLATPAFAGIRASANQSAHASAGAIAGR